MLILTGAPALSPFRRDKLLTALREVAPAIASVHAEFVQFVATGDQLDGAQRSVLDHLLVYGP